MGGCASKGGRRRESNRVVDSENANSNANVACAKRDVSWLLEKLEAGDNVTKSELQHLRRNVRLSGALHEESSESMSPPPADVEWDEETLRRYLYEEYGWTQLIRYKKSKVFAKGGSGSLGTEDFERGKQEPGAEAENDDLAYNRGNMQPIRMSEAQLDSSAESLCWESLSGRTAVLLSDTWRSFDILSLEFCTKVDKPVAVLAGYLLMSLGVLERIPIDKKKLERFLIAINDRYADPPRPECTSREEAYKRTDKLAIPYHNRAHAVDVLHAMFHIMRKMASNTVFTDLHVLAIVISAAVHDVDHKGLTNDFHTRTWSEEAILYSDHSVNESHHLHQCFELLTQEEFNFVEGLGDDDKQCFRQIVLELVFGTDMKRHFELLREFKRVISAQETGEDIDTRLTSIQIAMKLADLRHCFHTWERHCMWTDLLEAEMWRQGDLEKREGLNLGPFNDAENPKLRQAQSGFMKYIILDMVSNFCQQFPAVTFLKERAEQNLQNWEQRNGCEESDS